MENPAQNKTKQRYPPEIYGGLPSREEMSRVNRIWAIAGIIALIVSTALIIAGCIRQTGGH